MPRGLSSSYRKNSSAPDARATGVTLKGQAWAYRRGKLSCGRLQTASLRGGGFAEVHFFNCGSNELQADA